MRFGTDQLKRKALRALEEAAEQTFDAPVQPSHALRFALAFLYALGEGERWPFDRFWEAVTRGWGKPAESGGAGIARAQTANACLNAIYLAVRTTRRPGSS